MAIAKSQLHEVRLVGSFIDVMRTKVNVNRSHSMTTNALHIMSRIHEAA